MKLPDYCIFNKIKHISKKQLGTSGNKCTRIKSNSPWTYLKSGTANDIAYSVALMAL